MIIFRLAMLGFVASLVASKWGDLPHADTKLIQGTWEIVSVERSGVGDPSVVGFTVQFVGDEVHFQTPLENVPITVPILNIEPLSDEKIRQMAFS